MQRPQCKCKAQKPKCPRLFVQLKGQKKCPECWQAGTLRLLCKKCNQLTPDLIPDSWRRKTKIWPHSWSNLTCKLLFGIWWPSTKARSNGNTALKTIWNNGLWDLYTNVLWRCNSYWTKRCLNGTAKIKTLTFFQIESRKQMFVMGLTVLKKPPG